MSKIGRFINFGSSSKGNCYYLELISSQRETPYKLLLEVGFDFNYILKNLTQNRIKINEIDGVLVSHEHDDHAHAIRDFIKRGFEVYAPMETFEKYGVFWNDKNLMKEYEWKTLASGIRVLPLPLEHFDKGARVTTYGYIISIDNGAFNILFCTDTKYLPQDLSAWQFDMILIEANYLEDTTMYALRDAQENKDYGNISRYSRLVDSHMSLENLARTLDGSVNKEAKPFNLSRTQFIGLIHLSSNKQTNPVYYKEFIKNYLFKTKDKTNVKDNIDIRILKRDGGFL